MAGGGRGRRRRHGSVPRRAGGVGPPIGNARGRGQARSAAASRHCATSSMKIGCTRARPPPGSGSSGGASYQAREPREGAVVLAAVDHRRVQHDRVAAGGDQGSLGGGGVLSGRVGKRAVATGGAGDDEARFGRGGGQNGAGPDRVADADDAGCIGKRGAQGRGITEVGGAGVFLAGRARSSARGARITGTTSMPRESISRLSTTPVRPVAPMRWMRPVTAMHRGCVV